MTENKPLQRRRRARHPVRKTVKSPPLTPIEDSPKPPRPVNSPPSIVKSSRTPIRPKHSISEAPTNLSHVQSVNLQRATWDESPVGRREQRNFSQNNSPTVQVTAAISPRPNPTRRSAFVIRDLPAPQQDSDTDKSPNLLSSARSSRPVIGSPRIDQSSSPGAISTAKSVRLENCTKCGLKLTGTVYTALNRKWHKSCFKCHHCEKVIQLPGEFISKDGNPYCLDCKEFLSEECKYCSKNITRAYVRIGEMKLHPECYAIINYQLNLSHSNKE